MPPKPASTRRQRLQVDRALVAVAAFHRRFDPRAALAADPLRFAHRYADPDDRALVALLSALMAFGRIATIGQKLEDLCLRLGPRPAMVLRDDDRAALHERLRGFKHRTFRGADVADLLFALGEDLRREGRVLAALERAWDEHHELRAALGQWVHGLRAAAWPGGADRAQSHLLPDPSGPSASKRLMLFLRWVVRRSGVDLGLSSIPASALLMPVDVHVHRIARNLGFTARTDASWRTAEEITAALRGLSADDPVQYDFALCHLGISGRCPSSNKLPERCEGCALRTVCVHWR
ncbi:MAG: TIGR02757 family protein [Deltaproteobacteria bacterium]|nr:TIGR02757 family protein [Myxococcales bacterium]MDP3220801.1 TIGR02757 family protein [Deltaproteobacteria bacterium]